MFYVNWAATPPILIKMVYMGELPSPIRKFKSIFLFATAEGAAELTQ